MSQRIVVDTGPIIALFDASDAYHQHALEFVRRTRANLISSLDAITEAMYVLEESLPARRNLLKWISMGGLSLVELEAPDFERIAALLEKYADLPMDFTDAVLVALCERLGVHQIASVDRDFSIYRFKGRTRFTNVFLDQLVSMGRARLSSMNEPRPSVGYKKSVKNSSPLRSRLVDRAANMHAFFGTGRRTSSLASLDSC